MLSIRGGYSADANDQPVLSIRGGYSADAMDHPEVTSVGAFAPRRKHATGARLLRAANAYSLRNDAKVQHGATPRCIKVYRSVLNCIVTYPNVSKCIETY